MRLELSPEDAAFREEMRTFFTTRVPQEIRDTVAAGRELTKDQIVESQRTLNAAGLAVPGWPVEWGGQDWTPLQRHIWHEEMQRACVPLPLAFNASMVGPVIATFGSQEQKERFLPATANLDIWWSQGFSEPDAGSDLASLRTTAVRDGDEWVVNGQKTWTTLGQYGDWIFNLVRTDPDAPKRQQGISFLLIDMSTPGVTVRPIELIDGGHEVNEVFFEDVRVPAENLVGEENKGWDYAKFLLGNERVGVAPVGATKRMLAAAKAHAATAGPGGTSLLEDPLVAAQVAELENELLALELTALRVVAHSTDGKPHPASSVLKLKGTELQQAVSELVVDLAGPASLASGAGAGSDLPEWTRLATPTYLNLRKASIYGGSNEVQRQIIAGTILGL
ncbi:acyl-CoA dehydrogenase family protein [Nocardioides mesophilus]|uniref:Acyl-CoA dehydrogenase family protein n=1 Tax=Nocardioides mesophilus TaxID=433659 RepID=A0A7G9R7C9_9ACTN|nr:acyl-CoA dehydrogenase family protein [Nocardioides mesophilus]QNN51504.1 acyl-CoA dehydrogenase family protein [Nocardioides mesophilus]